MGFFGRGKRPDDKDFPLRITIEAYNKMAPVKGYLLFEMLDKNKVLSIHTLNSVYKIALVDATKNTVAIQGGKNFLESELVTMTGSTSDSSSHLLIGDCVVLGLGLVAWRNVAKHPNPKLVTSAIRFIALAEKPELAEELRREAPAL